MKSTLFFIVICSFSLLPQTDTTFNLDLFSVKVSGKKMEVFNPANKILFEGIYNVPVLTTIDLDGDGLEELLITDYFEISGKKDYILYVYSAIDSFSQSGKIFSGYIEPYFMESEELGENIIITGNKNFNTYNEDDSEPYYPLFCWKYENDGFILINNELYDIFISENISIIDSLDNYFESNVKSCISTGKVMNLICAGYINYLSAGEISIANQFFRKYYFCDDSLDFKKKIENLINKDH